MAAKGLIAIMRPTETHRQYKFHCPFCHCAGWHITYDDGSIKHANGITYGPGAIAAKMLDDVLKIKN
jgi:hypothetical protein